jgi:hypothetical protein
MSETIAGIKIPNSKMAKDLTELIRDSDGFRARNIHAQLWGEFRHNRSLISCIPLPLF